MSYKDKIEALKAIFNAPEVKPEEKPKVQLEEEVKEDVKEEAPKAEYVTIGMFNEMKETNKKFMETVTEMLDAAMEMLNSTEKNKVPVEASEVKEKEVEELSEAKPVLHTPKAPENVLEKPKYVIGAGGRQTTEQRAMSAFINSLK